VVRLLCGVNRTSRTPQAISAFDPQRRFAINGRIAKDPFGTPARLAGIVEIRETVVWE
jgi:hypothetical protein